MDRTHSQSRSTKPGARWHAPHWKLVVWTALLALALCVTPFDLSGRELQPYPAKLRFEPRVVLAAVAREMNVVLDDEEAFPEILLESTTPLGRFQDAIAVQWGFRPHVFSNAYAAARNEIYLIDDAGYYSRLRRTIDDSLAHELVHYVQVKYLKADLSDPSLEGDAIAVQAAFRAAHMSAAIASTDR